MLSCRRHAIRQERTPQGSLVADKQRSANRSDADLAPVIPSWAKVWALRSLVFAGIGLLCLLAGSGNPAFAFAVAWVPNYPFLGAVMIGVLRLPRFLEPVYPIESALYRWVGVGLIKSIVTSRAWRMLVGLESPQEPTSRDACLERIELVTKGAEICHGAAFVFASSIALLCFAFGRISAAAWILAFNIAVNGYPIMLQRSIRWRVREVERRGSLSRSSMTIQSRT
jgi:hypothetical protein